MVRDARAQFALTRELDELAHVLTADLGLLLGNAAEPDADDLQSLDQQIVRARRRGAAAEKAEHKDAAAPRKTAQTLVEHVGADWVVDDIDAAVVGQRLDPLAQPFAVVDRVIGAFFETGLPLLPSA